MAVLTNWIILHYETSTCDVAAEVAAKFPELASPLTMADYYKKQRVFGSVDVSRDSDGKIGEVVVHRTNGNTIDYSANGKDCEATLADDVKKGKAAKPDELK